MQDWREGRRRIHCRCGSSGRRTRRRLQTFEEVKLAIDGLHRLYLLIRLRKESSCEDYIDQLIPSSQPICKIKVKIFGSSSGGKSTLIQSMKAGWVKEHGDNVLINMSVRYFSGFFRRSRRGSIKVKTQKSQEGSSNGKFACAFHWHLHACLFYFCTLFVLFVFVSSKHYRLRLSFRFQ